MQAIRPGIVTSTGETIYPTGNEWILAFAIKGCQWAIDIVETWEHNVGEIQHGENMSTLFKEFEQKLREAMAEKKEKDSAYEIKRQEQVKANAMSYIHKALNGMKQSILSGSESLLVVSTGAESREIYDEVIRVLKKENIPYQIGNTHEDDDGVFLIFQR